MLYRPYDRKGISKYPHFAADMSYMIDNLALQFGAFYHCNQVFSILNVEQHVLNFRGQIMYVFIARRVLSDGRLDSDIVDLFSAATGDHKWIAAHHWYQASGKPQVTFEETRQKMIDEFLADKEKEMLNLRIGDRIEVDGSKGYDHGCCDYACLKIVAIHDNEANAECYFAESCHSCHQVGHDHDHVFAIVGEMWNIKIENIYRDEDDVLFLK